MIIRFMQGTDLISDDIKWQEKTAVPFTPSHVEALTPDGGFYIGAHLSGGVMKRPVGYDKGSIAKLPDGYDKTVFPDGLCELLLTVAADPATDKAFYEYLDGKIGEPYDWKAIIGFLLPEHFHLKNHVICSALITLALRFCGRLAWPLAVPAHEIDPRDLLLIVSSMMMVPGI
jgi:hypothetical protein